MDELRWLRPVYPNDTLHMVSEVLSTRPSSKKTDRGYVDLKCSMINQNSETVMTVRVLQIIRRKDSE